MAGVYDSQRCTSLFTVVYIHMAKHTTLAQFEFFVLISIDRLGPGAYAADIRSAIEDRAQRSTALGAVYAALGRLEDKGFLRHEVAAPSPVRGGRGRKRFGLTDRGRAELARTEQAVLRMLSLSKEGHGA